MCRIAVVISKSLKHTSFAEVSRLAVVELQSFLYKKHFYKNTSLKIGQKLRTTLEQAEAELLQNAILNKFFFSKSWTFSDV